MVNKHHVTQFNNDTLLTKSNFASPIPNVKLDESNEEYTLSEDDILTTTEQQNTVAS